MCKTKLLLSAYGLAVLGTEQGAQGPQADKKSLHLFRLYILFEPQLYFTKLLSPVKIGCHPAWLRTCNRSSRIGMQNTYSL